MSARVGGVTKVCLAVLVACSALNGCVPQPSADAVTVTGSVTYRERMALLPEDFLTLRVTDHGGDNVRLVTERTLLDPGQVPIDFRLVYDRQSTGSVCDCRLAATIFREGRPLFTTPEPYELDASENSQGLDLLLRRSVDTFDGAGHVTPTGEGPQANKGRISNTIRCQGNEPFWNVTVNEDQAVLGWLGAEASPREFQGAFEISADEDIRWSGQTPELSLTVTISDRRCLDTMADGPPFPLTGQVEISDGRSASGCCRYQNVPPNRVDPESLPVADLADKDPADDWSALILELMPAMRSCLGETPAPTRRVQKAWPMNRGMAGVRTSNDEGERFDCVAPLATGQPVDRFERLSSEIGRVPGEGLVIFSPRESGPPRGSCYQHERLLSDQGEPLGYLSYDTC